MRKKILSLLLTCIMACAMFAMPVAAAETVVDKAQTSAIEITPFASNYFSGSTLKMNALGSANNGASAKSPISSGSVNANAKVTSVSVSVTWSSGSDAAYLYVQSPNGNSYYKAVGSSTTLNFSEFNGQNPNGTWYVWLVTRGTVSTATARMTVNYSY